MSECAGCRHFDDESTELPVCVMHGRYMHWAWTCGDFEPREHGMGDGQTGVADAPTKQAEG